MLQLILLAFVCTDVTSTCVFWVRPWVATLIGFQKMTMPVGAATWVARINRRASSRQGHRLGRSAIIFQRAENGIRVIQIAGAGKGASIIAAQVVSIRGHDSFAVSLRVICDDAVLDREDTVVLDAAAGS